MLDDEAIDKIYRIICRRIGCKELKFFHCTPDSSYVEILTSIFEDGRYLYMSHSPYRQFIGLQEKIDEKIEEAEMRRLIVETILEMNEEHDIYSAPMNGKLILKAGTCIEELLVEGDLEDD